MTPTNAGAPNIAPEPNAIAIIVFQDTFPMKKERYKRERCCKQFKISTLHII